MNKDNLIQWTSGYTGLLQWNSRGFDTDKCRRAFFHLTSSSPLLSMLKIFIFFFFIAHFLLVENTYKNPYSLKAVNTRYTVKYYVFALILAL
jgi:hypothetical protein